MDKKHFLNRFVPAVVALLLVFGLGTARTSAQTIVTGGLSGTVSDPTGAIVEGANVS